MKDMTLKLLNQITKRVYTLQVVDLEDSRNYYHLKLQFTEPMDEGEFSFELFDEGGSRVSNGVLQVGDYTETNNEYNTETNGIYTQYNG